MIMITEKLQNAVNDQITAEVLHIGCTSSLMKKGIMQ